MNTNKKDKHTVAIATLGCKVNQCESASFHENFTEKGYTVTPFSKGADIYVINTCAVTAKAAAQSRQLIRKAHRTNPHARVVVTGCYAQVDPEKIAEITSGSLCIVGNANKHQLVEAALAVPKGCSKCSGMKKFHYFNEISRQKKITPLHYKGFAGRTRTFLKIQDGCNNFCTYCIVPHARGRSRSLTPEETVRQAMAFAAEGYKEIVLTGIHVGHYGLDLKPAGNLLEIIKKLLKKLPEIRFRLSSLEPTEVSYELLQFMADTDNFMNHLHIPLQSGSDTILNKMNRRYSVQQFMELVYNCREIIPDAAIGVDVLAGFPGETENDFLKTYELVASLPITYLHVFPYSKRPGTPAAKMAKQVPAKIKEDRVAILRKLDHKKRMAFYTSRLGKVHHVLVESEKSASGLARGFTENYIPVHFKVKPENINCILPVKLEKLREKYVSGTLL
ncbi:tRNA (N(6)-L-threonylcarbamoyladenosine(37)-C(2))-methylthiotransferase MtaB [Thermodesulfobacteriota bacterium]